MENLNAEQVKKDLQKIVDNYSGSWARFDILSNALALINSQEQRIGELEKRLRYLLQSKTIAEYDEVDIHTKEYVKDIHSLDANIKGLTVENERLRAERDAFEINYKDLKYRNKELTAFNRRWAKECAELQEECDQIKADTVRKMQERLDKHFCHDPAFLGVEQRLIMDVIDQIAKEMLEGEI